ncbi:hypothetical protein HGM15179_011383 [Zosterops borbonicus]|uniref:Uncharacterized protein n=1 Tax=Zosterops borbonicus TaxID=364589 RepID=A0A8K1LJB0_9PASS|nr:hypothetical protein HGM15179_011383 [Zosterops borbonicus]
MAKPCPVGSSACVGLFKLRSTLLKPSSIGGTTVCVENSYAHLLLIKCILMKEEEKRREEKRREEKRREEKRREEKRREEKRREEKRREEKRREEKGVTRNAVWSEA